MKVVAAARLYLRKYTHNLKFQNKISALQTPPDKTQAALAWIFRPAAGKYWCLEIHQELGELLLRKDEFSQVTEVTVFMHLEHTMPRDTEKA
jgi:hypothetical protein